jgi:hypothetical protein
MLRPKEYSEAERRLAGLARKIAMQRDVLYHGTRHAQSILTMGVLFHAERGLQVCFTRSAEEAAYWALLERDHDEGRGSIFAFDRRSLQYRYNIASDYLLSLAGHNHGGRRPADWTKAYARFSTSKYSPMTLVVVRSGKSSSSGDPLWRIHRVDLKVQILVLDFGSTPIFTRSYVSAMRLAMHCHVSKPPCELRWINIFPNDLVGAMEFARKRLIDEALSEKNSAQMKGQLLHWVA